MDDIPFDSDTSVALARMNGSLRRATANVKGFDTETRRAIQTGRQFGAAFGNSLEGLVFKGQSLNDTIRNLGLSLSRIAFRSAFRPLEQGIGNVVTNLIKGASTAGRGTGAPTDVASWAANTSVIFNVSATDAESFQRSEAQIASLLARAVGTGQRNM